jgi:hypothetical protein
MSSRRSSGAFHTGYRRFAISLYGILHARAGRTGDVGTQRIDEN